LFDKIILPNIEVIKDELTEAKEIKELVTFFKEKHRPFFNEFIIQKQAKGYAIIDKSDKHQIVPPNKATREFIDKHLSDNLIVLPYDFSDFNNEDGIIKGESLHSIILDLVDVDEHKDILVNIAHYKEEKILLLQKLSEIRLVSKEQYEKESYEYKVLQLACEVIKENDILNFQEKIIIETEDTELSLSKIPLLTDKIKIDDYELSLAKILPDNYGKIAHLSSLINQFIELGLNKERIGNLFGISEEPELSNIFQLFSEQVETLENADQLAFVILYNKHIAEINLKAFKVVAKGAGEYDLTYNFYTKQYIFLNDDAALDDKYKGIKEILKKLPFEISDKNQIIEEPYFLEENFICPDIITENLTDDQKLSFIDFLFNQWKNKKTAIKNIDWSKIDDTETVNILGFNPITSVYPSKYACESEALPDYLIKWLGKEESKMDFLTELGVWTEKSVIVELRKYLSGKINVFHNKRLSQETRFNLDETVIFNSFEWLKENKIKFKTEEQFETFKKVVEIINENRDNNDLILQEEFDFEELGEKSTEWQEPYYLNWKEEANISISLYECELPKSVSLDEIENYAFYYFYEGNTALDDDNNIYINENSDIKKELRKLELVNEHINFDGLWQNKLDILEKDNEQLRRKNEATLVPEFDSEEDYEFLQSYREGYVRVRAHWRSLPNRGGLCFNDYFIKTIENQLQNYNDATIRAELNTDISKNDQKEANREAKVLIKEKLENEGFEFTEDTGSYSTINGVFKDDIEFPLVVKSYKYQDEPLKIGANEWIQLMRPNSMFWAYFGNGILGCLKLYELLKKQDKLTISFSTENLGKEERLAKFSELLHYFSNVHFDFNSIKPSDYSVTNDLDDYRFDERRTEEELTSDDESLL
jgi:hypothetical protein